MSGRCVLLKDKPHMCVAGPEVQATNDADLSVVPASLQWQWFPAVAETTGSRCLGTVAPIFGFHGFQERTLTDEPAPYLRGV